jgi:hypothetical protein
MDVSRRPDTAGALAQSSVNALGNLQRNTLLKIPSKPLTRFAARYRIAPNESLEPTPEPSAASIPHSADAAQFRQLAYEDDRILT